MSESYVYFVTGSKEKGTLSVYEVYPTAKTDKDSITGKNAELIVSASDAQLLALTYYGESPRQMECAVRDKNGKRIGKTPLRPDDDQVYGLIAKDVAEMLGKDSVKITIR